MDSIFDNKSITIDKESLLDDLFLYLKSISNLDLIYRGSTNKNFKLIPSLYRFNLDNIEEVQKEYCFENDLFEGFDKYVEFKRLEFYQTLQHYGIRTKLLDFTTDPFIGLLFSVCDWPYSNNNSTKDGELIIFERNKFKTIKETDFDLLGDLLFEERNGINGIEVDEIDSKRKVSFSKSIRFINGVDTANERIRRQKGCFLLFPNLSEKIKSIHKNSVYKRIIIKSELKDIVIKKLKERNQLTMASIY